MFLLKTLGGTVNWIIRLLTFLNEYYQIKYKTNHNNSIVPEKKKIFKKKKKSKISCAQKLNHEKARSYSKELDLVSSAFI